MVDWTQISMTRNRLVPFIGSNYVSLLNVTYSSSFWGDATDGGNRTYAIPYLLYIRRHVYTAVQGYV